MAVDQIDDAIGQVGREVGTEIYTAIFAQTWSYVDSGVALGEGPLDVGVGLIVAQQDVEARLLLLDQVILERERFSVVGYDYVVDIDGFADERAGFCVLPPSLMEIGRDARAEVFRLADVDNFAFGVFVEIDSGERREATDFAGKIHI